MVFENAFKDKSVLITGAGRGIGKALAIKLASLGATVWAVSKNPDNLATLKSEYPNIEIVAVDLGDWAATREAIQKIPVVDCLVNNAGVCPTGNFMNVTPQDFDTVCNVNLKSVFNVSQIVAGKMIEAGRPGSIVNVSSVIWTTNSAVEAIEKRMDVKFEFDKVDGNVSTFMVEAGLKASPTLASYSTLKAALDQLTKIMAIELGPNKIRVNSVNPAGVPTDMLNSIVSTLMEDIDMNEYIKRIPLGRPMLEMDEVINTILFYLSDLVPIITGTIMPIDGGFMLT